MSTKIEDFIKEHKKEFDTDLPSGGLWDKIEMELDKKKQKNNRSNIQLWIGIAASVTIVLSIAFIYTLPAKKERINLADVSPGSAQKQVRFASLIEQKRDSLQIFEQADPELYQKFSADLQQLSVAYESLKKQLPASPNQKLIVKAMLKNLETQLQVVSQQLSIISEVSDYKKENSI
jgi:hypothetical protein